MAINAMELTLDLNPTYRKKKTVWCSQLDNVLRTLAITMTDGGTAYDVQASGYDVYIEGTKPDKKGFSYNVADIGGTVSGSVITIPLQTQMTVCKGVVETEIVLKDGEDRIGSANFLLVVEIAGLDADVDTSETEIPAYIDAAERAATEATAAAETATGAATTAQEVLESIPSDYTDLSNEVTDLKSALDEYADIFTADVDESVQNWLDVHPEATTTVQDGSLTFSKFNSELKEQINRTMFNDLYKAKYIGHKGLNGWISGTTSKPVVQSNSLMALDFAKTMGIKFVETDTTVLSDGTWVISHDLTTENLSGTLANLIDIDINDYKSRKVIKEYLTNGVSWTYSTDDQYTPITLEEYLLRAKELGLYVLPEVKYLNAGFTSQNWIDFGDTVKRCGMENSIVIYTAYTAYMRGMFAQLPNTPVCNSAIKASNADELVVELSKYPYAFACTGETDYAYSLNKCISANIPLGLWVIDDCETAKTFIADGGTFLVTEILTDSINEDGLFLYNTYGASEFYNKSADYAQGGSASYSDGVIALATDAYRQKYLHNIPVSAGDILEFSCYVKTVGVGEGQLFINNTQSSTNKRQLLKKSTATEWEKVTIIYVAGKDDTFVDIAINNRNMTGTSSTIYFKDIAIKHYNRKDQADWIALNHVSYAKQGKVVTVTRDSNISVEAYKWTAVDTLPPDVRPPRTLEFTISMGGSGTYLGILKIDRYGTISIYCSAAQSVQYYTITYII